jgi:hypothetical protein
MQKQLLPDEKIKALEILDDTRSLLVQTDFGVRVFKIKRGAKQADM